MMTSKKIEDELKKKKKMEDNLKKRKMEDNLTFGHWKMISIF
jgi:hypothetical protein